MRVYDQNVCINWYNWFKSTFIGFVLEKITIIICIQLNTAYLTHICILNPFISFSSLHLFFCLASTEIFFFVSCKANQRCNYSLFQKCFAHHSSGIIIYFVNHLWCQTLEWQIITMLIYNQVPHPSTLHSTFSQISHSLYFYLFWILFCSFWD